MSRQDEVTPTRSNLLAGRRRLARVSKGAELLRRKRGALVAELVRLARPAASARALISETAAEAYRDLVSALGVEGQMGLQAIAWPQSEVVLQIRPSQVWGIPVAEIMARPPLRRTLEARGQAASATGPAVAGTATRFETLSELLLEAAQREVLLQRLGQALTRTSRQVNTLEHRVAPQLQHAVTRAQRTLQEHEREEHSRLVWLMRRSRERRQNEIDEVGIPGECDRIGNIPDPSCGILRNSQNNL